MATTVRLSAVIVRFTLSSALDRLRRRYDPATATGVPAHITILYPFMPVAALDAEVRRQLAGIAAVVQPFEARFARVGRFPGVVYLAPDPVEPFTWLTNAIAAQFPPYQPYGGAHAEVVPHLTLTDAPGAPIHAIDEKARRSLPFARRVSALEVIAQDGGGRWIRHWRIPLG